MGNPEKPPLHKDFEPIERPEDRVRLLTDSVRIVSSTTMWTKNQEILIETYPSHFSHSNKTIHFWIPKDTDLKAFENTLQELGSKDFFFSLSHPKANLFFRAPYLDVDNAGFKFSVPDKLFSVQRRKNIRVPVRSGYVLKLSFPHPLYPKETATYKVHDFSKTGLGFMIDPSDEPVFPVGLILKNLQFKIKGELLDIDGEVRHCRPIESSSEQVQLKVGIEFTRISEDHSKTLFKYIQEENRNFISWSI